MSITLNTTHIKIKNPNYDPEDETSSSQWYDLGILSSDMNHVKELIDNLSEHINITDIAYKDMIADSQISMVATREYKKGDYIAINSKLYQVTVDNITDETELSTGTNVKEIKLVESIAENTGDIAYLKTQLMNATNGSIEIDLSDYADDTVNFTISGTNEVTRTTSGGYESYQITREPCWSVLRITTQSDHGSYFALLKDKLDPSLSNHTDVSSYLAYGETGRHYVEADKTVEVLCPTDCVNIFVFKQVNSVNVIPNGLWLYTHENKEIEKLNNDLNDVNSSLDELDSSLDELDSSLDELDSSLDELDDIVKTDSNIQLKYTLVPNCSICSENGETNDSSIYASTDYIDVNNYSKIKYRRISNTTNPSSSSYNGIAFYDKNKNYLYGVISKTNQANFGYVDEILSLPPIVKYVRCTTIKDSQTYGNFSIVADKRSNDVDFCIEPFSPMVGFGSVKIYDGTISTSTYYLYSDYIYCKDFDYIEFSKIACRTAANKRVGLSFYDDEKNSIATGSGMFYDADQDVAFIASPGYVSIPIGASYLRYQYLSAENTVSYALCDCYIKLYKINKVSDRIGRSDGLTNPAGNLYFRKPKNAGIENAIKRMHQMSNIKWTPLKNFTKMLLTPDHSYTTSEFVAGVEYTGLPYSPSQSRTNHVGVEKTIDSFMSAIDNEKSRQYDESIASFSNHAYYGSICSSYIAAALGLKGAPLTVYMPNIDGLDLIAAPGLFNEKTIELGDIILQPDYHVVGVSGILTNENGNIKLIEISEEALIGYTMSGKAVSKWFTVEQFMERFALYGLYRYKYIDKVEYAQSDYSQVPPEGVSIRNAKKCIYPVFGDTCIMPTSSTPLDIAVSTDAYSDGCRKVAIYKNNTLLNEETITDSTDIIHVERTVGKYYGIAFDTNDKIIDTISWEVLSGTFSKSINSGELSIAYNTNGYLYAAEYDYLEGGGTSKKFISIQPVTGNGTITINTPDIDDTASVKLFYGNSNGVIQKTV